ncbi:MAG: DNA repair protein RadA [Chloroflexi bacterium]|nr:DNA repair protein RadA [Chloroflexota bacterium]
MPKDRTRALFFCQQCGRESPKWVGYCPGCHEWNSYVEAPAKAETPRKRLSPLPVNDPQEVSRISDEETGRIVLPFNEFNRVLGGGIVPGSLVLISGDPGIGKSTLLLQVAATLTGSVGKVLYASGEESVQQVKLRANRLGLAGDGLFLMAETNLDVVLEKAGQLGPCVVIIDSIQTAYLEESGSTSGSVGQIRECAVRLMQWAKSSNIPVLITGHVTKDGAIAGPRLLEHMVDAVLYLEGEHFSAYRVLRGVKNRFGSTNEVGVFEMRDQGLVEVENPSEAFLSDRSPISVGSVVIPTLEGTRPFLVEVQALTSTTSFGLPRRTANGVDLNRLLLVIAVLAKRVGLSLFNQDIIVNVVGGLKVGEPAADLGIALAIASSLRNKGLATDLVAVGEVGLSGEIRMVSQMERRLGEAAKLGFGQCLMPRMRRGPFSAPQGLRIVGVESLAEAVKIAVSGQPSAISPLK